MSVRRIVGIHVIVVFATALAPFAQAQVLEEITVTAQKREQNAQDVGMSVTGISGDVIRELNLRSATDIASQTPGLAIADIFAGGGNQAFTLRGVGLNDFSEHNESPVALYTDGVYQATLAGANFQLFDIERVEVLRGPQGTLYGRNTTGGLVHYLSKRPTATPEGYVDLQYAKFNERRVEGALSGPIGGDFRGRVSLLYDEHDGWRPSSFPGVRTANQKNAVAGRLQIEYAPGDDLKVLLSGHAASNHTVGGTYKHLASMYAADGYTEIPTPANVDNPGCVAIAGAPTGPGNDCFGYHDTDPNVYRTDNNREPFNNVDAWGTSLTVDATLAGMSFTSITAYEQVRKKFGEDTDMGPIPAIAVSNPVDSKQFSQELRLSGRSGALIWTGGAYYYYRKIDTGSRTDLSGIGLPDDDFTDQLKSKSASLFGQLEYAVTDQVSLIGGMRYSHEDQKFELLSVDHSGITPVFLGISANPIPDYVVFDYRESAVGPLTRRKDNLMTWRGEVNWRPAKGTLLYASIARGTKSAGWNGAIDGSGIIGASRVDQIAYAPEKLLSYEVGVKTEPTKWLRVNASAFYYDYKDFQAFTFDQLAQVIGNRPAKVKGLEIETTAQPSEHWDVLLGLSVLDTKVENVATLTGLLRERQMVLAPKFAVNGLVRYHVPVSQDLELALQADSRYVGKQFFDLQNNPIATEPGFAVANASVTLSNPNKRWSASVWVKNLFDRDYRTYAIPVTGLGFTQQMYGQPRWFGGTVTYRW